MDENELVLDGNAAAGVLAEIFGADVTGGASVCDACGADWPVAELVAYTHAPGLVLRCRSCSSVMVRIVQTRTGFVLDLHGCRSLEVARPADRP